MTVFDRYLLRRFLYVFLVGFFATFGLFVIFDGFTNVDAFQEQAEDDRAIVILLNMAEYYLYQSSLFFEISGPILAVIAVMTVLALILKHSEIYPILAAGVPMWRLLLPLMGGCILVSLALIVNQEIIIPRIASHLQAARGADASKGQQVEEAYDRKTGLEIFGEELFLTERTLRGATFTFPVGEITRELTVLRAPAAVFYPATSKNPAGWLLKNVMPGFDEISLAPAGRKIVRPVRGSNDAFVVTDVAIDQLNNRNAGYRFLSTPELIRRIRNPSFGLVSLRSQALHLHSRLTRPLSILLAAVIATPLVIRRESRSIIASVAISTAVLGGVFLVSQAFLYLGKTSLVGLELAAWGPLIFSGSLGAWLSGFAQT